MEKVMKTVTQYIEEVEGVDCEVTFKFEGSALKAKTDSKIVIGYLVHDDDYQHDCDCEGKMISFHRHSRDDHAEGLAKLGNTKDGDADLDAVWSKHEDEAVKRYLDKCCLDFAQSNANFQEEMIENVSVEGSIHREDGESDADFYRRCLVLNLKECINWNWGHFSEVMSEVLAKMWNDPEFFPGDPDAVLLACYSHSGEHWSISGQGTQCRWDTSNSAGVWFPDECLKREFDSTAPDAVYVYVCKGRGLMYQLMQVNWSDEMTKEVVCIQTSDAHHVLSEKAKALRQGKPEPTPKQLRWGRAVMAEIYCKQFLETFNSVNEGDVWGVVVETYDLEGNALEHDACWGYVGSEYAKEALKEQFDSTVKKETENETQDK